MRPARLFVEILLILGILGAMINGSAIYWRLLYAALMIGVGAAAWTVLLSRSLTVQRSARVTRANVGDIFEERFDVLNDSPLFASWIDVMNDAALPFSAGSRLLTLVGAHQRRSYVARSWLTRRGAFQLGPTRVSVGDPFGLFRFMREVPARQSLLILPKIFELTAFIFPPGLLAGGQVIRRKSADVTPHAAGIREYEHGDAMKRIHWPSSMRRGRLMVKEFEQDPQAELWIFLDAQRSVHAETARDEAPPEIESAVIARRPRFQLPASTMEYSVTIAASLMHFFLARRRAVGLVSAGQAITVLHAERSERQESKILETLAFVDGDGELPLAALCGAQSAQMPQGSSVILLTPSTSTELIFAVEDLLRRHLSPVVVLLDAESFGGAPGTESLALALRARGVPVCVIACGADLARDLSQFSFQINATNVRLWRTPELSPSI